MAERLEAGLLQPLGLRRMGVDRGGDILKPGAHFDGQRKGRGQFGAAISH